MKKYNTFKKLHLAHHLASERGVDVFRKFRQGDAVARQECAARLQHQLRAFNLLFHVEVGHALHAVAGEDVGMLVGKV